jgi:hypothetical protein
MGMVYAAQGKRAEAFQIIKKAGRDVRLEIERGALDRSNFVSALQTVS